MNNNEVKKTILHNVANEEDYTAIQQKVLHLIAEAVSKSFGPYGTNTAICKKAGGDAIHTTYTKDGHTIGENIAFQDVIENTMKSQVNEVTRNIKIKIGDGSTSATVLADKIFAPLKGLTAEEIPYRVMEAFKQVVADISKRIEDNVIEFTPELAYKIAMVATNEDVQAAETIRGVYEKNGTGVHLTALGSTSEHSMLKEYDGLTINAGFGDTAFINMKESNKCLIQKPKIYVFKDPVDTPAMGAILDKIIQDNIWNPLFSKDPKVYGKFTPTAILMPRVSRDFTAYLDKLGDVMRKFEGITKPPIVIIPNVLDNGTFDTVVSLLGAKPIMKYINPEQYAKDVEAGLACNGANVHEFAGECEQLEVTNVLTKFVNPSEMFDKEDPNKYSNVYSAKIEALKTEIEITERENHDKAKLGILKKQLHGLECNMVEFYVGGISPTERDYRLRLITDAVMNCRSAAQYGVGYGCNFEAFRVINKMITDKMYENDALKTKILGILDVAYKELLKTLFKVSGVAGDHDTILDELVVKDKPLNVVTQECDDAILSSIKSDIIILESIARILTVVITSNQFLCPDFIFNKYTVEIID